MCLLHRCAFSSYIYSLCEEILSFWSNHCWFMMQGQSWSVPWHICDFYSIKWGTKRKITTFGIFSTTIFDIECRIWMKLAPVLVPLETWFWFMLFLDLLSAKPCLRFLIELIEQILHTIKVGEILWSQVVYTCTHNGACCKTWCGVWSLFWSGVWSHFWSRF
jgi:hypothetical protein